jgi:hypothetical protein
MMDDSRLHALDYPRAFAGGQTRPPLSIIVDHLLTIAGHRRRLPTAARLPTRLICVKLGPAFDSSPEHAREEAPKPFMSYDEEQTRRSRVVVKTPQARGETVHVPTHYPPERQGYSIGVVVAVALTAIAATAIIFLFLSNPSDNSTDTNINLRATTAAPEPTPFVQAPVIVNTPMTMPTPFPTPPMTTTTVVPPPVVIAPPTTTVPDPVATLPPANTAPTPAPTVAPVDDATLETRINRAYGEDTELARANVDLRVVNGRVILTGSVATDILRQRAERLAYAVKGVRSVENRILVANATP